MNNYISRNIPLRVVSEIGKGAYGQVYECTTDDNRTVAVKRIIFDKFGIRCLNEASIMSSIKHQHIAHAQNVYCDEGSVYIVSQKAKTDLNKWTRKSKKGNIPDSKTLMQWSKAIVSALSCLHSQGVIHCDMKASNIIYFGKSDIKLNDFTLSVVRHTRNKKYNHNICTSTHRPYEVWIDQAWDEKVDIWGLACTLFEIAYGQLLFPYQGGNNITEDDIKKRMIDCLHDWAIRGPVQGRTFGNPKSKDFLPFELPQEFFLPENKLFNSFILSMLHLEPNDRPSIFQLQEHPYLNQDNTPFKKISFLVFSTEGSSKTPKESFKMRLYQFLSHDIFDFMMELYSRSFGLRKIDDEELLEHIRIAVCVLVACKLLKHPLPITYFTLSEQMGGLGLTKEEQLKIFKIETKFCEYLSFRLHVSPNIALSSSTTDSFS
jgi:serine/threonine protein kinase